MKALIVDTQHLWFESKNARLDRVDYAKLKAHFGCAYNYAAVKLNATTGKFAESLVMNGWSIASTVQFVQIVNADAAMGERRKITEIFAALSPAAIRQMKTELPVGIPVHPISIGHQAGATDISQLQLFQVWGAQ